ncbi:GntR family transcriptional regulator [Neolewinella aurantiaca]|uniref:GntR family transcriptional regulator n=1 Tax=Neolewinella aurantiaca TaxID=2602767 RepID=A0A5C7FLV8_9BACT|nr:GntR family transcriptional regulator [Neolewinella aurantiaca]TXF91690.1 GntR family transcriptional regulator [Neolewinella aurantiaca]
MQIQPTNQGIYRQIADFGIEQVLAGIWSNGEKIPSVRQLAMEVGVNPNTVMHAYDYLKDLNIIETRRGLGFFVSSTGHKAAVALRRSVFLEEELPRFRRTLDLLGIDTEELIQMLNPNPETDN